MCCNKKSEVRMKEPATKMRHMKHVDRHRTSSQTEPTNVDAQDLLQSSPPASHHIAEPGSDKRRG